MSRPMGALDVNIADQELYGSTESKLLNRTRSIVAAGPIRGVDGATLAVALPP